MDERIRNTLKYTSLGPYLENLLPKPLQEKYYKWNLRDFHNNILGHNKFSSSLVKEFIPWDGIFIY